MGSNDAAGPLPSGEHEAIFANDSAQQLFLASRGTQGLAAAFGADASPDMKIAEGGVPQARVNDAIAEFESLQANSLFAGYTIFGGGHSLGGEVVAQASEQLLRNDGVNFTVLTLDAPSTGSLTQFDTNVWGVTAQGDLVGHYGPGYSNNIEFNVNPGILGWLNQWGSGGTHSTDKIISAILNDETLGSSQLGSPLSSIVNGIDTPAVTSIQLKSSGVLLGDYSDVTAIVNNPDGTQTDTITSTIAGQATSETSLTWGPNGSVNSQTTSQTISNGAGGSATLTSSDTNGDGVWDSITVAGAAIGSLVIKLGASIGDNVDGVDRAISSTYNVEANSQLSSDPFGGIGGSIGSQIGELIGGSNPFVQIAAGTVLGAIGNTLQQAVNGDLAAYIKATGDTTAQAYGNAFETSFETTGVSLVSSQLTGELLHALGITGFGATLANFAITPGVDAAVTYEANIILQNLNLGIYIPSTGGLDTLSIASFFGQQLGQAVIAPQTQAAVVLADIGSTIGADIGSMFGPIGTFIGSFIGDVIGTLIGDLFGHRLRLPTATAAAVLQIPNADYALGATSSSNGGDLGFAIQMANAAATTLNGIMYQVVGAQGLVANTSSPTQTYGLTGTQVYVSLGGQQYNENTGSAAVDKGVLWAIRQTELIGGNIFAKRVIEDSTATDVTSLMADLQIATDYTTYRQSWQSMNQLIAANPNSAFTAGWIVTFQRANELGLDNWNTSDFYGGMQGFLSSFGLGAMASGVHYENIALNFSGSALTLSVAGGPGVAQTTTDPTSNAAKIYQLYETILDRAPDPGGWTGWLELVEQGMSLLTVSGDFIAATAQTGTNLNTYSNAQFIDYLYQTALGRTESQSEQAAWVADLNAGDTRANVALYFSQYAGTAAISAGLNYTDAAGSGLFSILPSASLDGRSLSIGGFITAEGYTLQSGVGLVIEAPGATPVGNTYESDAGATTAFSMTDTTAGNNIFIGGNGGNTIKAGSGYDWIQGGSGTDTLTGGSGYDVIIAGSGTTTIYGGSGGGYFAGNSGVTNVYLGAGAATVVAGTGTAAQTNIASGTGAATLIVSPYSAWDSIYGRTGAGVSNTVSFERYTHGVTADLTNHPTWLTGASGWNDPTASYLYQADASSPLGYDFSIGVQNVKGLIGSNYNDVLKTSEQGGTLEGLGGADQLIGGGGVTTASYQHSSQGVFVDLSAESNNLALDPNFLSFGQTWGDTGDYILTNNIVSASPLATASSTQIIGGVHVLTHSTVGGTPVVNTVMNTGNWDNAGFTTMTPVVAGQEYAVGAYIASSGARPVANSGNWTTGVSIVAVWWNSAGGWLSESVAPAPSGGSFINGLASAYAAGGVFAAPTNAAYGEIMVLALSDGTGPLSVSLADPTFQLDPSGAAFTSSMLYTGQAYGGDATGDTFSNVQNLLGSSYDDELQGLYGSVLNGGPGDDTLDYSGGNNSYIGGGGFDTVNYSAAPAYDGTYGVDLSLASNVGYWDANGDTYSGISKVIGTPYTDYIYGTATGTTFDGGGGNDYLYGGAGPDTYIFNNNYGVDIVTDNNTSPNTIEFGAGISFDDLWIGTQGGSSGYLQLGIRGQSGYIQVNGNFGAYPVSGNDIAKTLDMNGAAQVDISQINYGAGGSDNAETITTLASNWNMIFAYGGNDTIYADNNQVSQNGNVIDGGLGNDTIYASNGDDQYLFERGDGQDTIYDTGGQNTVVFGPTVAATDVIYQIVGDDLYIGIRSLTDPSLTASQVSDNMRFVGGGDLYQNTKTGGTTQATVDYVIAGGTTVNLQSLNLPWTVIQTGGSGGGGGGGGTKPIVLDLYGDGLQLSPVANSDIVTKDANGVITRMGWVGPDDGILAVDRAGNGQINTTADISFIQDAPGATNDLQGLAGWDTNHDGVINDEDAGWNKLLVWVDKNQDGVAEPDEVMTMAQAGVTSISLNGAPTGFTGDDTTDSYYDETTTFTKSDGTTGTAYDVALAREFLTPDGFGNAPDVTWDQVTANAVIGQLLNNPIAVATAMGQASATASDMATATNQLSAVAQAVGGAKITEAELSKLAVTDFSGGTMSAADAARWADFLDPSKNAAMKAAIAAGMTGSNLLSAIRGSTAFPLGTDQLTGRGISQAPARAAEPIIVDFGGRGLDLISATASNVKADIQHTGNPEQVGWVGGDAGILAYDLNGDGKVDPTSEISFAMDKPGATTSIQGLAAFDTNGDGVIDAQDTSFSKFLIWRDANGNGASDPGETETLQQAGIASISLKATNTVPSNGEVSSNQILGQITVTMADGTTRTAFDTALGVNTPSTSSTPPAAAALTATPTAADSYAAPVSQSASPASTLATPNSAVAGILATLANASTSVEASRLGEDGPEGTAPVPVVASATSNGAAGWWMTGVAGGISILDSAPAMTLAGGTTPTGSQSAALVAASSDAATVQRQLLLRQSMAAFQASTLASAPVWSRQPDSQTSIALTAASSQASTQKTSAMAIAG